MCKDLSTIYSLIGIKVLHLTANRRKLLTVMARISSEVGTFLLPPYFNVFLKAIRQVDAALWYVRDGSEAFCCR